MMLETKLFKTVCSLLVSASIKTADVVVNLQSIIQSISIHPISLMSSKIWTNTNLHLDIDMFQGQGENWGTPPGSRKSSKCKVRVPRRPSTSASELINWSLVNRYNSIIHDTFSNCNLLHNNGFCVGSCWINAGDPIFTSMTINWSISFNFHNLISRSYHAWSPFTHPTSVHTNQDQFAIKSSTLRWNPQQKHKTPRILECPFKNTPQNKEGPSAPMHDVPPSPIQHEQSRHNCVQISLSSRYEKVEENLQPMQISHWCMRSMVVSLKCYETFSLALNKQTILGLFRF